MSFIIKNNFDIFNKRYVLGGTVAKNSRIEHLGGWGLVTSIRSALFVT